MAKTSKPKHYICPMTGLVVELSPHAIERGIERMRIDDEVPYSLICYLGSKRKPGKTFFVGRRTKYVCKRCTQKLITIVTILSQWQSHGKGLKRK